MAQDRTPYVEVLEEEMQGLATQRGSAYIARATAQRAEEADLTDEAARAALGALSQRADASAVRAAADAALDAAEAALVGRALPVVLDEFGRDENMAARLAIKQRYSARVFVFLFLLCASHPQCPCPVVVVEACLLEACVLEACLLEACTCDGYLSLDTGCSGRGQLPRHCRMA